MPTVLIVAASPSDQDRLRLGAEVRDIRHALQRSKNREDWKIESNEAATVDDLRRALLDCRPTILHFAGHGSGASGLCFEDTDGNSNLAGAEPLSRLFHHFKDELKCVVLNACYSKVQGEWIQREIDYVIGMNGAVDDNSATKFAVAFYDAIFAGTGFRAGFDLGCTALDLNNLPDADAPVFLTGSHLETTALSYTPDVPEIERVLYLYLNAPYLDRAKYTTTGESLLPLLRRHYGERMHRTVASVHVTATRALNDDRWCVETAGGNLMYVRVSNRVVLVEWEASVGLWSIPVKTFLATASGESAVARVHAELDNYYNFEFKDASKYQSISLEPKEGPILHGYAIRGTDVYHQLMGILSDGNTHAITVELRNHVSRPNMPLILNLLSDTWVYQAKTS